MQFKIRSYQKEHLDNDDIPAPDLFRTLVELDVINKRLGGYKASKKGLAQIIRTRKEVRTILDLGFGGGDFIRELSKFGEKYHTPLFFYGVDLKMDCINYAQKNLADLQNKELICDDYRNISPALLEKIDVIHCSLFLHHLTDDEILSLFRFAKTHNCIILANDLHRHWLAYYSISILTAVFSKSWLVKDDAGLSVRRAFRKKELESLLQKAGYTHYSVKWNWAFRFTIIAFE
jgi:2-polyprenyl-3-methyl-5-hydroxy-6-metoxy-1,4-benzoquinol methylase